MKTHFLHILHWAADHRRIVALALVAVALMSLIAMPTTISRASFSVDTTALVSGAETWFNLLFPVALIGLSILLGIGILRFVMRTLGGVFGGGGLKF